MTVPYSSDDLVYMEALRDAARGAFVALVAAQGLAGRAAASGGNDSAEAREMQEIDEAALDLFNRVHRELIEPVEKILRRPSA